MGKAISQGSKAPSPKVTFSEMGWFEGEGVLVSTLELKETAHRGVAKNQPETAGFKQRAVHSRTSAT